MIPSVELQSAVMRKLQTGPCGVFDKHQQDRPMPFITVGEETMLNASTKTEKITDHLLTVHTWSDSIHAKEIKEINHFVISSLTEGALTVGGFIVLWDELDMCQTMKEQDANTTKYHGVIQIEYQLQEV
jgi:hypothetical protein